MNITAYYQIWFVKKVVNICGELLHISSQVWAFRLSKSKVYHSVAYVSNFIFKTRFATRMKIWNVAMPMPSLLNFPFLVLAETCRRLKFIEPGEERVFRRFPLSVNSTFPAVATAREPRPAGAHRFFPPWARPCVAVTCERASQQPTDFATCVS